MEDTEVIESLFPSQRDYPANSLTPGMITFKKGTELIFLFKADNATLLHFLNEPPGGVAQVETTVAADTKRNPENELITIQFELVFKTGRVLMKTGLVPETGRPRFIRALMNTTHLWLMVVDEGGEYVKTKRLGWQPDVHAKLLRHFA